MDPIGCHDELVVMVPLAVLLALHSSVVVLGLVHEFSLSLTLVLLEYCGDGLLTRGVACCEVEQLPCSPQFAMSKLMDECLMGCARVECSDHVCVHDIGGSLHSFSCLLLAGFEILGISKAHIGALKVPYEDAL